MAEPPAIDANLGRMLQPRRHGGQAAAAEDFLAAVDATAAADSAAGWLCAMVNAGAHQVARLPDALHDEVWSADGGARVVACGVARGALVRAGRNWLLTGRWPAVLGAGIADWLVLTVAVESGHRTVLVPRHEVDVEMLSFPGGLAAAGIGSVTAAEVTLPGRWVHPVDASPSIIGAAATAAVLGCAGGAWQAHVTQLRQRLAASYGSAELGDQMAAAQRIARVASDLDAARLQVAASLGAPLADAVWAQRQAVGRARSAADQLLAGSRRHALDSSDPVSRGWQDVHTGCGLAFSLIDVP